MGVFPPGFHNAITDVEGVRVGHSTIIHDEGPARTGVTAILPNNGNVFMDRMIGGAFVLNGAGEVSGLVQVQEWGLLETAILLTNTHSVGTCSGALAHRMSQTYPTIGDTHDVLIPLVGECDDSYLNDIVGQHVKQEHVDEALETAAGGPVSEGAVGGGTGMISFDVKGGIGTSSRLVEIGNATYTVGILVMSNVGRLEDLRIDGVDVGARLLREGFEPGPIRPNLYGSIIAVLATDAPLSTHQINRLCKRVGLGIGRAGSYAAHGSGEIVLGFSTANQVPRDTPRDVFDFRALADPKMDNLYRAAIECTEEAMINAMCMAVPMNGIYGHYVKALPLEQVASIMRRVAAA
ncbi:MAG: P1 family peptidase [bacterium]